MHFRTAEAPTELLDAGVFVSDDDRRHDTCATLLQTCGVFQLTSKNVLTIFDATTTTTSARAPLIGRKVNKPRFVYHGYTIAGIFFLELAPVRRSGEFLGV